MREFAGWTRLVALYLRSKTYAAGADCQIVTVHGEGGDVTTAVIRKANRGRLGSFVL